METVQRHLRWAIGVGALLTILLIAAAALRHGLGRAGNVLSMSATNMDLDAVALPVPRDLVHTPRQSAGYVGSEMCVGCHPEEAKEHGETPPAHAARFATVEADGSLFRQRVRLTDPETQTTYSPEVRGRRLLIRNSYSGLTTETQVDLALGSGSHGITYIAVRPDGSGLTPPISVFNANGRAHWDWSPGARSASLLRDPLGRTLSPTGAANCVGCHSTRLYGRYCGLPRIGWALAASDVTGLLSDT